MATERQQHFECKKRLKMAQEAEFDNRQMVREADYFLNKRDGQWEPEILSRFSGRPKYTFDECNPIVDDIMGEMENVDFDIRVSPSGTASSKEIARVYEGIIRTIENMSAARFIYNGAARIMVGTGLAGWRVINDYRDDNSFQQDLLIKKIPNFQDTVWFDENASEPDMSDADYGWVLTSLTRRAYRERFPNGSGLSVDQSQWAQAYSYKKSHEVIIGEYLYKKSYTRELALLSNGKVVEVNDDFNDIRAELLAQDISVERTRKRKAKRVYQRLFDGGSYLTDAKKTVFNFIPIIPVFGNFKISENKVIYWGATEKLMDAQRVINYAESRKIEEGALGPRGKMWMTKDSAKSPDVIKSLRTLNVNTDPVQFYDYEDGQPAPVYQGSPVSNPGLQETSQSAQGFIARNSGTFDEARGTAPAGRSGTAVDKLQVKSDNPKHKWFTAMEVAMTHTSRILTNAIPLVYDTKQQMRLTFQDGTTDSIVLRDSIQDKETGKMVRINDLSAGKYDVVCKAGPAFHSRQQETTTAINDLAIIDPSIMQIGGDIFLNNINAPGMDKLAERKRLQMIQAGVIPQSQMTEEEKQMAAQMQEPQPDPTEQANLEIAAAQKLDAESKAAERAAKAELEAQKLKLKELEVQLKQEQLNAKANREDQKALVDAVTQATNQMKLQAETLKILQETIAAPGETPVIKQEARQLAGDVGNA